MKTVFQSQDQDVLPLTRYDLFFAAALIALAANTTTVPARLVQRAREFADLAVRERESPR